MNREQEEKRLAWEDFQKGKEPANVKPEILESWKRAKALGANPYKVYGECLTKSELEKRICERKAFYDTAVPFMQNILNCFAGEDYGVTLYDEEGYALKILLNNKESEESNKAAGFIAGCNRNEDNGDTGFQIAIRTLKPVAVVGYENYHVRNHDRFLTFAPVTDHEKVLGCISLTGYIDKINPFILSLIGFAAEAISKQLMLRKAISHLSDTKKELSVIIENFGSAVILTDSEGFIVQTNNLSEKIFRARENEMIGKHINNFINPRYFNPQTDHEPIDIKEILNSHKGAQSRLSITVEPVYYQDKRGWVVYIRETKTMHKLASRIAGSSVYFTFDDILGNSQAIKAAVYQAQTIAKYDSTVLLHGKSGTGKELFAQAIHAASNRNGQPFVAINCAALPRELVESELFGYEDGAFTGAKRGGNPGKFELANGGTIFLDEIGDMPLDVQSLLLRVIQNKEVTRIGGRKSIAIDVRIIAATNMDLSDAIKNNMFREDLYYRINAFNIEIPPLKDRRSDIKILAEFFLNKHCSDAKHKDISFTAEALDALTIYDWPGNVRELEHVIESAFYLCDGKIIDVENLPESIRKLAGKKTENQQESSEKKKAENEETEPAAIEENVMPLEKMERDHIICALAANGGNVSRTAAALGISRRTIYRKMEKYGISVQRSVR